MSDYLKFLFQDNHIAVLLTSGSIEDRKIIITEALKATNLLPYKLSHNIYIQLKALTKGQPEIIISNIQNEIKQSKGKQTLKKMRPWLMVVITILVLVAMFIYGSLLPK